MHFYVISVYCDLDLCREAEVADISVPKSDNFIIHFNSQFFQIDLDDYYWLVVNHNELLLYSELMQILTPF